LVHKSRDMLPLALLGFNRESRLVRTESQVARDAHHLLNITLHTRVRKEGRSQVSTLSYYHLKNQRFC
jgi:hypothetical protein